MLQFYQHVLDHLLTHWGICLILLCTDMTIYYSHNWYKYKLRDFDMPDSLLNVLLIILFNQFIIAFPIFYIIGDLDDNNNLFIFSNIYKIPLTFIFHEILFYYLHRLFHISFL